MSFQLAAKMRIKQMLSARIVAILISLCLGLAQSWGDLEEDVLVFTGRDGPQSTAQIVGTTLAGYVSGALNCFAVEDFEKLKRQAAGHGIRAKPGDDLATLVGALREARVKEYLEFAKLAVCGRLRQEFILRREPALKWHYDPETMRRSIEYSSRGILAGDQFWAGALADVPVETLVNQWRAVYQKYPPSWQTLDQVYRTIDTEVANLRKVREHGCLEFHVWRDRPRLRNDRKAPTPGAPADWNSPSAEMFNWWADYLGKWRDAVLNTNVVEIFARPWVPRTLLVGRVEEPEDSPLVQRLVNSLGAGVPFERRYAQWEPYRELLGFEREFGFTNRHVVSMGITNGLLNFLIADGSQIYYTPITLNSHATASSLFETFIPRLATGRNTPKPRWTPLKLSEEGWKWVTDRLPRNWDDRHHLRVWVGAEVDDDNWQRDAGRGERCLV